MNPLGWSDALFLGAYMVAIVSVVCGVRWLRRAQEQSAMPPPSDLDPYSVAVLRGGAKNGVKDAAQLALLHLQKLGAVVHEGFMLRTFGGASSAHVVEQTLLNALRAPRSYGDAIKAPELLGLLESYQRQLETQGLLPDAERRAQRQMLWAFGSGCVVADRWRAHRRQAFPRPDQRVRSGDTCATCDAVRSHGGVTASHLAGRSCVCGSGGACPTASDGNGEVRHH